MNSGFRQKTALFLAVLLLAAGLAALMRGRHRALSRGEIYEALVAGIGAFETQIELGTTVDHREAEQAFFQVCYLHPEFFWLKSCTYVDGPEGTCVQIDCPYPVQELSDMYRRLCSRAAQVTDRMPSYGTEYRRVLYLHDYLVTHVQPAETSESGRIYDAYGALVEGRAVCGGYSHAMLLLMQNAGLTGCIVEGPAGGDRHSWNYVRVDGQYYWLDVTWDDPGGSGLLHDYCLTDDAHLLRSHTVDTDASLYYIPFVPECGSMDGSFYAQEGTLLDRYDLETLSALVRSHDGRVELMFTQHDDYTACLRELRDERRFWEIPGTDGRTLTTTQNDVMDTLILQY
ncbi:MAG: hypothetical protein IJ055_01925 [Oscillospiraceae bacterium]|nr:hypothetical protein [Oscillospiraceae bacterium]